MKNTHSSSCDFEGCVNFDFLDYFLNAKKSVQNKSEKKRKTKSDKKKPNKKGEKTIKH
jgi:hypothetical protein